MRRKKKINLDDPLLAAVMREQFNLFVDRFGHEPTAQDPVFFCWHSPTPRPMCELCEAEHEHSVMEAAMKAGLDPARALNAAGIDDPLGSLKTTN